MSPNFKQTDIGLIPDDWKLIHLDDEDYFETLNGLWKGKKSPFIKINVLRNTNFTNSGKLDYSDVAELDVEIRQYEKRKLLFGDIIIERSGGGPAQPVGRVVFFDKPNGEFSFSNFTSTLRIKKPKEIHHKFLFYSLLSFYFSGRTYALQGRTTGIRNLDFNKYKTTSGIPKLPFSEQRKIAHILTKIQHAIETQEQIIKATQELKKALMQKLFTEGINNEPQKQTDIGLIPKSWEVVQLQHFALLQRGKDLPKEKFQSGNYPVTGSSGIIGYHSKYFVTSPGVTVGRSGSCGIVNYYESDFWAHNTTLYVKDFFHNDPKFVFYKLQHLNLARFRSGVSVPTLNRNAFSGLLVSKPALDEQKEIASILSSLNSKIEFNNNKKIELQDLFKTMLNQLMSGQLRVKDIDLSALADLKVPSREGI